MIAPGPRAAEEVVLGELERLLGAPGAAPDLTSLAVPVRVVVPSRSLRLHLASALVRRRGRAVAGVEVVTLFGVAAQVLHRAGEALPQGEALFGVLARRWAREVPALAEGLDDLVDGYGAVAATVRDFLDAGLEPAHAEGVAQAAVEAARADGRSIGTAAERRRAASLVHLAATVESDLVDRGIGHTSHLFRQASALLKADPDLLPARAVLIHGFGDATAVAADLLEVLLGRPGSLMVLDRPPRAVDGLGANERAGRTGSSEDGALEATFTERLFERLARVAGAVEGPGPLPEPARLHSFSAPGAAAEARELARRIRGLLDRDDEPVAPEELGVVVRELRPDQPYATALRRAFERAGIPFSGVGGTGPLLPAGRRLLALLELLRRHDATPTGRWLDSLEAPPDGGPRHRLFELRLAFHSLGAGRLGEVAAVAPERFGRESFPLPIRQGLETIAGDASDLDGAGDEPAAGVAARRRVPSESLRQAAEAARRLVGRLRSWPGEAPLAEHLRRLRELLAEDLAWRRPAKEARGEAADPWAVLDALEREVPGALVLSYDELFLLLDRTWERNPRGAGRDALGGRGGGVAVLGALEARGRTFRHLFVAGLNRGAFPRTVQEDPLLPDDLRRALHPVLPDLPVKLAGFDEERYLFAQLLAAAPEVTLSWRTATEEGQPLPVSPLVERLALSRNELRDDPGGELGGAKGARDAEPAEPEPAGPAGPAGLRPPLEHATEAGLAGDRDAFTALLEVALTDTHPDLADRSARALATAHRAVLDEMDPDLSTPEGRAVRASLGPYFGFLGPPAPGDPRLGSVLVTALEGLSACPWQTFLRRLLRLEPTPDPLEALPSLDPLLVGSLVHAVLEDVVRRALPEGGPETLAEVLEGAGDGALGDLLGPPLDGGLDDPPAPAESAERGEPVAVPWPEPEELEAILHRRARRLLEEEGVALPGLARALAAAARPYVEAARDADWAEGPVPALAAEVEGSLEVTDAAGRARTLRFRADRVDAVPGRRNATFRLTDYKTGKPISTAKKETTRREHFLRQVAAGRRLQAVAYALAAGARLPWQPDAVGRYLFLRQAVEPEHRELAAWSGAVPFAEAFETAVRTGLAAWDGGAFFPRLVEPDKDEEPALCRFCEVREACLRGDSGARRRLAAWVEARRQPTLDGSGPPTTGAETALLGVWRLPSKEPA